MIIVMWRKTNVLMRQTSCRSTEMLEMVCSFQSLHPNSSYLHCSWQANTSNKRLICLFIIELVPIIWYATSHVNSNYLDNIPSESIPLFTTNFLSAVFNLHWLIDWLITCVQRPYLKSFIPMGTMPYAGNGIKL